MAEKSKVAEAKKNMTKLGIEKKILQSKIKNLGPGVEGVTFKRKLATVEKKITKLRTEQKKLQRNPGSGGARSGAGTGTRRGSLGGRIGDIRRVK